MTDALNMSRSNVAPLTISNLAMLEKQLNRDKKVLKKKASRRTLSRTESAMASGLDDDSDDGDKSRGASTRKGRENCKILFRYTTFQNTTSAIKRQFSSLPILSMLTCMHLVSNSLQNVSILTKETWRTTGKVFFKSSSVFAT